MVTTQRLDYHSAFPDLIRPMRDLEETVRKSGLERPLLELVRMRVSQINRCAYCIDMHSKDARAANESEQRLYALSAWREAPFFTHRERAALEWAETLTRIAEEQVTDELYSRVRQEFSEEELIALTLAIVAINGWNRFAIAFRSVPGSYRSRDDQESFTR